MIFLNKFSYYSLFTIVGLFSSCNSQKLKLQKQNTQNEIIEKTKKGSLEFEEMRRLNFKIDLSEVSVLKNFQEILDLYQKFEDPKYGRGYPIPSLQEDEALIIIKPPLKQKKYGDIEIVSITKLGETLIIHYKEIDNWEYAENKASNPILIIKIKETFRNIKLTTNS